MVESETMAGEGKEEARKPGILPRAAGGAVIAAFFVCCIAASQSAAAYYSGSYLPATVIGVTTAFWVSAAAFAGFVLCLCVSAAARVCRGRLGVSPVPAIITGGGFVACALLLRPALRGDDSLGGTVLLHPVFLCVWGIGIAALAAGVAFRSKSPGAVWAIAAVSTGACTALAYLAGGAYSGFVLVAGPPAILAASGIALHRAGRRVARTAAFCAGIFFSAIVWVAGESLGEKPLRAIDGPQPPAPSAGAAAEAPNVILIVIDTMRADRTSLCGADRPTTPNLLRLSAEARLFTHGVSTDSATLPSHVSMFTGKYPREHGARATTERGPVSMEKYRVFLRELGPEHKTIASYLRENGYATGAVAANYSRMCRQLGVSRGFAYYYDLPRYMLCVSGRSPFFKTALDAVDRLLGRNGEMLQPYLAGGSVTKLAQKWLKRVEDRPFFLFLNYMDPHCPYSAPPPFDSIDGRDIPYDMALRKDPWQDVVTLFINRQLEMPAGLLRSACNQYDGELAQADRAVGALIDGLKRRGHFDNTLIIVTSDHGESFGEHHLLGHSLELYEEAVRVPILVKYPGQAHAGEVIEERVSTTGIFATILEEVGLPAPEDVQARPLGTEPRCIVAENYEAGLQVRRHGKMAKRDLTVVYEGDYKYIHSNTSRRELYDLARDPGESNNLVDDEPEKANAMRRRIAAWREATPDSAENGG